VTVPIAAQLANQQRSSWVKLFAISKQFYDEPTYFGLIAAAPVNPLAFVPWIPDRSKSSRSSAGLPAWTRTDQDSPTSISA
jgi:hypothetical protein